MRRVGMLLPLLLIAIVVPMAGGVETEKCDLKHVSSGLWCDQCKAILEHDAVLEGKFCAKCCKDVPAAERVEAKKVKVCAKTSYQCAADSTRSWKPGECEKCGDKLAKVTDLALVALRCEGCGKEAAKAGPCDNPDCKEAKRMIVEVCAKSGTYPHVPEK